MYRLTFRNLKRNNIQWELHQLRNLSWPVWTLLNLCLIFSPTSTNIMSKGIEKVSRSLRESHPMDNSGMHKINPFSKYFLLNFRICYFSPSVLLLIFRHKHCGSWQNDTCMSYDKTRRKLFLSTSWHEIRYWAFRYQLFQTDIFSWFVGCVLWSSVFIPHKLYSRIKSKIFSCFIVRYISFTKITVRFKQQYRFQAT